MFAYTGCDKYMKHGQMHMGQTQITVLMVHVLSICGRDVMTQYVRAHCQLSINGHTLEAKLTVSEPGDILLS